MILVGLTGGIGSGKSTVSSMLAMRGATIVDADVITRHVQQPGSPVVEAIAERFGDEVLDEQRGLLRAKLAEIVFPDPAALADLNAIVHPVVAAEIARRVDELASTKAIAVLDIPLLTERTRGSLQGTVVVDVPVEVQIERLVSHRGFTDADARARIARQVSRNDRVRYADFVIDNSGSVDDLGPQIDKLWQWLESLPQLPAEFRYGR